MSAGRWVAGRIVTDVLPLSRALRANVVLDHILTDYALGHGRDTSLDDALDQVERVRSALIALKELRGHPSPERPEVDR